jgi:glycosyltransferase involved in cell wall biosynthesis
MPLVSVIMNCHNGESHLREAIDSVYAQTFEDWEIIFWDDASTDGSAEIARSYDRKLRYFTGEKAVSLGQARNWALHKAAGKFIAFLDADDIWLPQKLEKQIPLFEQDQSVGLVFSDIYDFFQQDGTEISHFRRYALRPPRGHIFAYLFNTEQYAIPMSTAVVRAVALDGFAKEFDIRYAYAEDFDLFLRIAYRWKCDYVNEPLAVYRIHDSYCNQKSHVRLPEELTTTMEKFCQTDPDFSLRYSNEIAGNRRRIAFQQAKIFWQGGRNKEARRELKGRVTSLRTLLLYVATYLPHASAMEWWDTLQRLRRKKRVTATR